MLAKHLIATAAVIAATATSATPALARTGMKWTPAQLQQLANAYRAKNPDWRAPMSSGVHTPADTTWTPENLDRLAAAYGALNPGWARPTP